MSLLWEILTSIWIVSEIWIALATRARGAHARVRDRGSMIVLWVVILLAIFAGGYLREAVPARFPIPSVYVKGIAIILLIAALAIRWTAIRTLGRYFTANVAIQDGHRLLRTGLYGWVRHPSYTGLLLAFVALAIHFNNWWSLPAVIVPITIAMLYRISVEETALREAFGEEYEDYRKTTRRLVPGIY